MLRFLGIICLSAGCTGIGWSLKDRLKRKLEELYQVRQIVKMMQNEVVYSRAPMPEACLRIAGRVPEPYREAFLGIHQEMQANRGVTLGVIWRQQMQQCVRKLALPMEEKERLMELGDCVGFADTQMQAQALEQYVGRLELSIERQEKEMANQSRVIMSLSLMGGIMLVILLI